MSKIESIEHESPIMNWLIDNSKNLVWGALGLILVLFLLFRLYSGSQAREEQGYLEADSLQAKIFNPEKAAVATSQLEALTNKLPNLATEYDGLLAQAYLNLGMPEKAAPLVKKTLLRVEKDSQESYRESSKIALLIAEGKLEESFAKTTALKEELKDHKNALYFFNLFRLGMLSQALGKKADEKKAWDEFISYAKIPSRPFQEVVNAIDIQARDASIITFIQERQKKLN